MENTVILPELSLPQATLLADLLAIVNANFYKEDAEFLESVIREEIAANGPTVGKLVSLEIQPEPGKPFVQVEPIVAIPETTPTVTESIETDQKTGITHRIVKTVVEIQPGQSEPAKVNFESVRRLQDIQRARKYMWEEYGLDLKTDHPALTGPLMLHHLRELFHDGLLMNIRQTPTDSTGGMVEWENLVSDATFSTTYSIDGCVSIKAMGVLSESPAENLITNGDFGKDGEGWSKQIEEAPEATPYIPTTGFVAAAVEDFPGIVTKAVEEASHKGDDVHPSEMDTSGPLGHIAAAINAAMNHKHKPANGEPWVQTMELRTFEPEECGCSKLQQKWTRGFSHEWRDVPVVDVQGNIL